MNKEMLKNKLDTLLFEINKAKNRIDGYSKEYLIKLEEIIRNYRNKIDLNELSVSNGGNLGFRRAILEDDNLADIDSLYNAACDVDFFYSENCKKWD